MKINKYIYITFNIILYLGFNPSVIYTSHAAAAACKRSSWGFILDLFVCEYYNFILIIIFFCLFIIYLLFINYLFIIYSLIRLFIYAKNNNKQRH